MTWLSYQVVDSMVVELQGEKSAKPVATDQACVSNNDFI